MKKLTIEQVKNYIENTGYALLSTEYIDNRHKLSVICPNKHTFVISFSNFQKGRGCSVCAIINKGKNRTLSYNQVKEYIEQYDGYTLLSTEYINNSTKLFIQCPQKHKFEMRLYDFKHGYRCPICAGNKKLTYEQVRTFVNNEGYELLTTHYSNNSTKLTFTCPKNHTFKMKLSSFRNDSQRCPICANEKKGDNRRLEYFYVKNLIEKEKYTLVSDTYKNNHQKLSLVCPNKHETKISFGMFNNGCRCKICTGVGRSIAEKEIAEYVKSIYTRTIIPNDRKTIYNHWTKKWLELDIWLPVHKKAIEFNGKYWHSTEDKKWLDEMKKKQCIQKGICLLIIKEENWLKDKNKCLKEIENFINNT